MSRTARHISCAFWVGTMLLGVRPANATPMAWEVSAAVIFTSPGWASLMPVGAPLHISINFDSVKAADCGPGNPGIYPINSVAVGYAGVRRESHGGAGADEHAVARERVGRDGADGAASSRVVSQADVGGPPRPFPLRHGPLSDSKLLRRQGI
jgi:hypothetical protein